MRKDEKNLCYTNQSRVEDGEVAQSRENKTLQDLGTHSFGIDKADVGSLEGRLEVAKMLKGVLHDESMIISRPGRGLPRDAAVDRT